MRLVQRLYLIFLTLCLSLCLCATATMAGERFVKLDAQGRELPDDAQSWAMVHDTMYKMYWEVKTPDDSIHSNTAIYTYKDAKEKFIAQLNAEKFGGFDDWRIPTSGELGLLRTKEAENGVRIDLAYFPNTQPAKYMSQGRCVSNPGYREENIKFGKKRTKGGIYVRAFRGAPLDVN